jgi:hypothetical protein
MFRVFFSVGTMAWSNSEPPMEKRMSNQQFDSGIFCFQLPSLVMLTTVWNTLSISSNEFNLWHLEGNREVTAGTRHWI